MESRFWYIQYGSQTWVEEAEKIADILVVAMARPAVHRALGIVFEATYVLPSTNSDGDDGWETCVLLKVDEEITEETLQERLLAVDREYEILFGAECYCEAVCEELFEAMLINNYRLHI